MTSGEQVAAKVKSEDCEIGETAVVAAVVVRPWSHWSVTAAAALDPCNALHRTTQSIGRKRRPIHLQEHNRGGIADVAAKQDRGRSAQENDTGEKGEADSDSRTCGSPINRQDERQSWTLIGACFHIARPSASGRGGNRLSGLH